MLVKIFALLGSIHYSVLVVLILLSAAAIPPWRVRVRVAEAAEVVAILGAITSLPFCFAFVMEAFIAIRSGNEFEQFAFINRAFGPYAWTYLVKVVGLCLLPHAYWVRKLREGRFARLVIAIFVFGAMLFEYWTVKLTSGDQLGLAS